MVARIDRAAARREQAAALARQDIIDAAARCFAQSGYRAAKMSDIASEAGFTAASLYTYFASKKDIFRALGEQIVEELDESVNVQARPDLSFEDDLERRVERLLIWSDRRRHAVRFLFELQWSGEPDLQPEDDEERRKGHDLARSVFAEFFEERAPAAMREVWTSDQMARALTGIVEGFVRSWLDEPEVRMGERASVVVRFFLYGATGEAR